MIPRAFDESTIQWVFDDSSIRRAFDDSMIQRAFDESKIRQAFDDSTNQRAFNESTRRQAFDDSTGLRRFNGHSSIRQGTDRFPVLTRRFTMLYDSTRYSTRYWTIRHGIPQFNASTMYSTIQLQVFAKVLDDSTKYSRIQRFDKVFDWVFAD